MFCHTANPKVTSQTFVWQVVWIRGEIGKQELKNYSQATNLVLTKAAIFLEISKKKGNKKDRDILTQFRIWEKRFTDLIYFPSSCA